MKQIQAISIKDSLSQLDLLAFGIFEGERIPQSLNRYPKELARFVTEVIKKENFKGARNTTSSFYTKGPKGLIKIVVMGLGKKSDFKTETARDAIGSCVLSARALKVKKLVILLETFFGGKFKLSTAGEAAAEASRLALYRFKGYRKSKKEEQDNAELPQQIYLSMSDAKRLREVQKGIQQGEALSEGVCVARDLINEPSNKMNPESFSDEVRRLARKYGFQAKILEKKDLIREKMGALLAVGQGSAIPPRLAVLSYNGKSTGAPIGIVGKGITFDTGGISLKPSKNMDQMKYDMSGGAAVVGVISSAARLKLPVRLVGLVPLAENMPSGNAIKPGDVVHSAAGLSIEVLNTDAEGRLVLADALHYAKRFKPKAVFDMATLTGAVIVCLGSRAIGAMGDSNLIEALKECGEETYERVWELPMWSEYDEDVKSEVADIQNIGKGEAGTIMGAKFLEPFVGKAYPWVHLDIAGTAWVEKKAPSYCPKGGRGVGVRLLIEYLRKQVK